VRWTVFTELLPGNALIKYVTVSRLYSINDRMIKEYLAVDGMRIGRGTDVFVENLPQCHFVHHKSNVT
jgi:hypothetical protein